MNDIKDVKPPIYLPDYGFFLWAFLVLLALGIAIYFLFRIKRSDPKITEPQVPDLPPWEKAYQQLEALNKENLIDKAMFKEYFTRVSDITRQYMENRFNIRAPHMSSEEFLYFLGKSGHLNESQKTALKEFLNSCDMVKFAKYDPTISEALKNFDCAKKLIDETKI